MFAHILLAVLITASAPPPLQDWKTFHPFIGTWSGTRTTARGTVSVTRSFESVDDNQHLLVSDRVASVESPWGLVSVDPIRDVFVLRRFRPDGGMDELVLSDVSNDGTTLVFDSALDNGASSVERITIERHGWSEFVERVEQRDHGAPFTVVSETQFRRKR